MKLNRRFTNKVRLAAFTALCPSFAVVAADAAQQDARKKGPKDVELSEKLLRRAQTGAEEDVMDAIVRLMGEAAANMEIKFDTGSETQEIQQEVLDKLDDAIEAAAMQRRPVRPPQSAVSPDRRRMAGGRPKGQQDGGKPGMSESTSGQEAPASKGGVEQVELPGGELIDVRRAWGHLPAREREEIIQGVEEEYLERYREWIERYYRALQESEGEPR